MKTMTCILTVIFTCFCACSTSAANEPHYTMTVTIEPSSGTIACTADIAQPADSVFTLSRDMTVHTIVVDGSPVQFERENTDGIETRYILPSGIPERMTIRYDGTVANDTYPKIMSQVNMVTSGLVELAIYVGWFPKLENSDIFEFALTVDLPEEYVTIVNGSLLDERVADGRRVTKWESLQPGFDMAVLAAPGMKKTVLSHEGISIDMYHTSLPQTYVDAMTKRLVISLNTLTGMLGPVESRLVRVAYSPRAGWGYVRVPFIIIAEEYALDRLDDRFGPARDFHYITHEIAHYWWHWADTGTPEDWINEGLAEYSAFLVSRRVMGKAFAEQMLNEYRDRARGGVTGTPIAETANDSPDREVNRYARPSLLFEETRGKYGDEMFASFLRELYARFSGSGTATTAMFLGIVEDVLGDEAAAYWDEALNSPTPVSSTDAGVDPSAFDRRYLGSWTGELIQAGTVLKVVFNLAEENGAVVPTLDSPDQDVTGIPVAGVRTTADSLYFRVPSYDIRFSGAAENGDAVVRGIWNQGGTTSPLLLENTGRGCWQAEH